MNKAIIKGRLGQDPTIKEASSGTMVARISIATDDYAGKGERKTNWHNVTLFGKQAETADKYLSKGREVLVEGRIDYHQYEDKWYTTIIADRLHLIGSKDDSDHANAPKPTPAGDGDAFTDTDIPF